MVACWGTNGSCKQMVVFWLKHAKPLVGFFKPLYQWYRNLWTPSWSTFLAEVYKCKWEFSCGLSVCLEPRIITSWVTTLFPHLQIQCGGGGRLWWSGPGRQWLEDHTYWCLQVSPLQKPAVCCAGSGCSVPYPCHRWTFILKYTQTQQHKRRILDRHTEVF